MRSKKIILWGIVLISALLISFRPIQPKPWIVPDKYEKMANPVKSDAESLQAGKTLWGKHCQSCHGKVGKGDGTKATTLKSEVGDLSTAESQKQTDGALFYKTLEGRDEMPSFKKKIPEVDEIWQLVNFMRTLAKK
ncbi:MAG: cytochrome c [Saprospiraceae bacterium]|nr:cytochrome c [Saprospiraceae bacterium]